MATQTAPNQIQAFYEFLGKRLETGAPDLTPEESVREFHAYQQELEKFRRETGPALEQSLRGETRPLDVDAVMAQCLTEASPAAERQHV